MSIEDRSTLVFASGIGRVKEEKPKAERPQGDGVVRIQLKRLGGGKMASVVTGIPLRGRRLGEGLQHRNPGRQAQYSESRTGKEGLYCEARWRVDWRFSPTKTLF